MKRYILKSPQLGMSLIELGLVMVIVSLALAPLVRMLGGPNTGQNADGTAGNGNVVRVVGQKSKEIILANAIVESALATNYTQAFGCGKNFDPKTGFPAPGKSATIPATRCEDTTYNQSLYYQWIVRNADTTDPSRQSMPGGNHYYNAVLNVWDGPSKTTPLLTLPTAFYWNENSGSAKSSRTGIVIVLDTSYSMTAAASENASDPVSLDKDLASPYLKYRYKDPSISFSPDPSIDLGDLRDNRNLDIVSLLDNDDPNTEWDDRYLAPNVMGTKDCDTNNSNYNSAFWSSLWNFSSKKTQDSNNAKDTVKILCGLNGAPGKTWSDVLNKKLSRIEAARSSLLSFLVSLEANPDLFQSIRLGFITFGDSAKTRMSLHGVDSNNQFYELRRLLSWINRAGPGLIAADGNSTNIYDALQKGADLLYSDPNLDSRIIFFVGDGRPTAGKRDMSDISKLSTSIGNGTYPGANGNKTTIFSLGLLNQDKNSTGNTYLTDFLDISMARCTPGGAYFFAQNIGDMRPIFEQVQYQIQRVVLLNKSSRYNIDLL
jgi:hypothetical protein